MAKKKIITIKSQEREISPTAMRLWNIPPKYQARIRVKSGEALAPRGASPGFDFN